MDQKQTSSLEVFITLRRAVIAGLGMSITVSCMQLADMSVNDLPPWAWRYTWFPQEGASHLVYFLSLVGMMILWCPRESSRSFGYSLNTTDEVAANDTEKPASLVSDDEEQQHEPPVTDDDPLDSPMCDPLDSPMRTNAVAPEPIGARQDEPPDLL